MVLGTAPTQTAARRGEAYVRLDIDNEPAVVTIDLPGAAEAKDNLAKRQANAAVALLKMGQPEKVWPLLKHSPDPRVRSYLIHRLSPLGARPQSDHQASGRRA